MMQPFATSLAQAGFIAVTFDFPGHGRNPTPLAGGLSGRQGGLGRAAGGAGPGGGGGAAARRRSRGAARPFHGGRHRHPLGLRPAGGGGDRRLLRLRARGDGDAAAQPAGRGRGLGAGIPSGCGTADRGAGLARPASARDDLWRLRRRHRAPPGAGAGGRAYRHPLCPAEPGRGPGLAERRLRPQRRGDAGCTRRRDRPAARRSCWRWPGRCPGCCRAPRRRRRGRPALAALLAGGGAAGHRHAAAAAAAAHAFPAHPARRLPDGALRRVRGADCGGALVGAAGRGAGAARGPAGRRRGGAGDRRLCGARPRLGA
ncbi:hypothetical protein [Dankookia sp. P2]|uniref:hypothetical protein n=1 Tax=Dankookia sp. P2 TaxID=3423955 RepID=UPI003D678691